MVLDYHILMIFFLLFTGPIGVLFNGAFIGCTLRRKELQKEYGWFLCGVAASDFIYCLNNGTLQVVAIYFDYNAKSPFCQVVGVILFVNGVGAVCMTPLLAMNRYVSLFYSHLTPKYFNRRNNALMLGSVYLVIIAMAISFVYLGDMGRMGNTICGPEIEHMPILHVALFVVPMFLSYGICIFCGYKILYLLKSHQAVARRQQLGSRLAHAHEIVHLIVLELVIPISLEAPCLLSLLISSAGVYIPNMVIAITISAFITHPVLDPVIVVVVMKPYRQFARKIWRSFRGINEVEPTTTGNVASTNNIAAILVKD